ncbi:NAD(P)/FAD-dependent oxidoreductase [Conexibacter sp. SYSU D00693]|uniref:phytoene desaturase family protein n=1 Tax=Conexibacter sp. SYSU D00693 TaxID=2812560 RepID=UPI00196B24E1|nr:NAD(P)/FAD-dependent oxidoreductase [Conexibacter sp. SYSU D00693]
MPRPALVIGAGPNGLSAAIALAAAGREVTVLEAAGTPGGAVKTEELTLPGFHHDVFSAVYPAAAASPVFRALPLERHGLTWIHPEVCYAHPLPDGTAVALHRDVQATAASLDDRHPGDGDTWATFADPYLRHFRALRNTLLSGFPPVKGPAELVARTGLKGGLDLARLLLGPAQGLGHELFEDQGNRAWLYGAAMHGDVPPNGAGSAIAAAYLNLLGHAAGWPSPEGGAARLAQALTAHLQELGGTIRTNARVTKVATERGKVVGVHLQDGDRVSGSLVLADVLPRQLRTLAEGDLPARYDHALARYRPGPATVKVDWALDGRIPWSAPVARRAGTVHVGGEEHEVLRDTEVSGPHLPEQPFMLLGQQTVADPTRAPAGKHTAWAYTHGPQGRGWPKDLEQEVERMEARIEQFAPGFRDRIKARHVMGPDDLFHRDANLHGGDVGAGSYALDQVVFRPLPSLTPYRTPIRGLYLCSAATFPGGAVHGVPGAAAAKLALSEARLRRF